MWKALLVVALGLVICLVVFVSRDDEPEIKPDRVIVYKQSDGKPLSFHVFLPKDWKETDARPVALFFFSGGWVGGSATQFYPQAAHLASRGMVGISADYRTEMSHGTSPKECVADGNSAIRWLRAHAGELGIDPERIAAGGGSAGGHVATASTFCSGFDDTGEDLGISTRANALLLFNPVIDTGPDGGWNQQAVMGYWEKISPAHNINSPAPPTMVVLGTEDLLIPVSTVERFKKRVENEGGRCDLHLYPGAEHEFFNEEPYLAKTIAVADAFLVSLGWLARP